jgi:hypothetical protein
MATVSSSFGDSLALLIDSEPAFSFWLSLSVPVSALEEIKGTSALSLAGSSSLWTSVDSRSVHKPQTRVFEQLLTGGHTWWMKGHTHSSSGRPF